MQVIVIHALQFDMTHCTNWDCLLLLTGKRRSRCGECEGCLAQDCGQCPYCADKPKFGGPGTKKQCCAKRKCESTMDAKDSHAHNSISNCTSEAPDTLQQHSPCRCVECYISSI